MVCCRVFKQSPTFMFSIFFSQYRFILIWTFLVHQNTFSQAWRCLFCICAFPFDWVKLSRYGLDGPGIKSTWGRDFPHPSRPTQPPIHSVPILFPGGKTGWTWSWPPTPSIAEVKERVVLYLYSPSGPSWPVIGWPLPLPVPYVCILYTFICNLSLKLNTIHLLWQLQFRCMIKYVTFCHTTDGPLVWFVVCLTILSVAQVM
jgi:hypothetical protein